VQISVHSSDPPSPWAGYKQALADPPDCTHLLVIQEDVLVCRNFAAAVERIAEAKPDEPVCLFLSWLPNHIANDARDALKKRERYIRVRPAQFCPVVAVLWPVAAAARFLEWTESGVRLPNSHGLVASDDAVLAEWIKRKKETVWIVMPSLVEHPDTMPSVKGRQNAKWGKDRGRIALHWIGPEADPLEFDWS
jgi:hypothetical protein